MMSIIVDQAPAYAGQSTHSSLNPAIAGNRTLTNQPNSPFFIAMTMVCVRLTQLNFFLSCLTNLSTV